jgi:diketogulonate reductase-like aldo/keto reductase
MKRAQGHRQVPAPPRREWSRRELLRGLAAVFAAASSPVRALAAAAASPLVTKVVPGTSERVPVVGMGSWITFDVPAFDIFVKPRVEVLRKLFDGGCGVVDSSPMYGHAEEVIGACLKRLGAQRGPRGAGSEPTGLLAATKVWTPLQWMGRDQLEDSRRLWGLSRFWLLQIHNMLAWEDHLETLRKEKAEGRTRYVGITTSHGRRHEEMEGTLKRERFDFVQLTYNIVDREVEQRLLPLAADRGIGVIANRPFQGGGLVDDLAKHPLPPWAAEIDCRTWAQFLLKFIVSHPAVTCAIPATTDPAHMAENALAARGRLPDAAMRQRMIRHVEGLL